MARKTEECDFIYYHNNNFNKIKSDKQIWKLVKFFLMQSLLILVLIKYKKVARKTIFD